jgi:opacity protein-like surface antigen
MFFAPWQTIYRRLLVSKKILVLAIFLNSLLSFAQVAPANRGGGLSLSAGAEYSNFNPDWGPDRLQGMAAFFDLDHLFLNRLGVEGEARWLRFNQPHGETEDNYLLGPRFRMVRFGKLEAYGKFLMGGGWITYRDKLGSGSYFAYAPGITGEYRLSRHWKVRGDYEYEFWPAAPGEAFTAPFGKTSSGLTPNGFSVGVSYRIF